MIVDFPRIINFLKRYLFRHPLYMFVYIFVFFLKDFSFKINFYTPIELIKLVQEGKSIIRLGDSEIAGIPLGVENYYHRKDKKIEEMCYTIIKNYSQDSPYILSVPRFIGISNNKLRDMKNLNVWLPSKIMFLFRFSKKCSYMDAHNFYYNDYFGKFIAPLFIDKKIICVTNRKTIEKQRKNSKMPWNNIIYVESPEKNAIDGYEKIVFLIDKEIEKYNSKDVVLFIAMGPVGKYLIYEYANKGYQGVDIGKVAEVMFTGKSIEHTVNLML